METMILFVNYQRWTMDCYWSHKILDETLVSQAFQPTIVGPAKLVNIIPMAIVHEC